MKLSSQLLKPKVCYFRGVFFCLFVSMYSLITFLDTINTCTISDCIEAAFDASADSTDHNETVQN